MAKLLVQLCLLPPPAFILAADAAINVFYRVLAVIAFVWCCMAYHGLVQQPVLPQQLGRWSSWQ